MLVTPTTGTWTLVAPTPIAGTLRTSPFASVIVAFVLEWWLVRSTCIAHDWESHAWKNSSFNDDAEFCRREKCLRGFIACHCHWHFCPATLTQICAPMTTHIDSPKLTAITTMTTATLIMHIHGRFSLLVGSLKNKRAREVGGVESGNQCSAWFVSLFLLRWRQRTFSKSAIGAKNFVVECGGFLQFLARHAVLCRDCLGKH